MNTQILKYVLIIFCLLHAGRALTMPVKLSGKAPDYAQSTIELDIYHDYISEGTIKLGDIHFNAEGSFELQVEINQTSLCFADFDGYHGMIYLEPGKSYQLVFPPKRNLSASQKKNPFVKPEPIWFGIRNPEKQDLNVLIQQFEIAYAKYENTYFDQIFVHQNGSMVDTVKQLLNRQYPKTNNSFFESHKRFKMASLEFALHQGKSPAFMEAYFKDTKPVYNLAAYSALFDEVFVDYFNLLDNTSHHTQVKNWVNTAQLEQLDNYFQKQLHFNKDLAHWVLLKSMKDGYYSGNFSKASILKMLDQVKEPNWSAYELKTALQIREKLTYLASGTKPPQINLMDMEGHPVHFSDYPHTYIYLQFTDPKNPICRQHLDALKAISARYKEKLIVINVIPRQGKFKNEAGWPGLFTTTDSDLASTYKVKTFPNSFLIGKDGKLLLSPAPNPIDGLDRQLGQIFKSEHFKDLQKTNELNAK